MNYFLEYHMLSCGNSPRLIIVNVITEGGPLFRKPVAIQSSARAHGRHAKASNNGDRPLPGLEGGYDNIAGTGFGADRGLWTPLGGGCFCVLCGCGALHFSYPALASAKTAGFNN